MVIPDVLKAKFDAIWNKWRVKKLSFHLCGCDDCRDAMWEEIKLEILKGGER